MLNTYFPPQPAPCPSCGHCPTCGQYKPVPIPYGGLPAWQSQQLSGCAPIHMPTVLNVGTEVSPTNA